MNCVFCDAPVADDAERCPSCSAVIRRTCPSCGKINPVHVASCSACGETLPPMPPAPEPTDVGLLKAPEPPSSLGSFLLRLIGFFLLLLAFIAAVGSYGSAAVVNCLCFSFV